MHAAEKGHAEVVGALLAAGAEKAQPGASRQLLPALGDSFYDFNSQHTRSQQRRCSLGELWTHGTPWAASPRSAAGGRGVGRESSTYATRVCLLLILLGFDWRSR